MAISDTKAASIAGIDDLIETIQKGEKPRSAWRIGAEHEKFVFDKTSLKRPAYEGEGGIKALLTGLMRFGWTGIYENEVLIGLERDGASVSLEPGGQFELSGAPLRTINEICKETGQHLFEVKSVANEMNVGFLGLGFDPLWPREDVPVMPKGRYDIMRAYMPKVGSQGLDMMLRTSTVQANLDFSSESDMVQKFRVSLALQPLATALFANSPFTEGKPNGFLSKRAHVWTDTDKDRTGILDFVFDEGFGYEAYVRYALDVPMYFVKRDTYIDASGLDFKDFMKGNLSALMGEKPTIKDWNDHLTTLFPEVRLKSYLEMRGADSGPWSRICALPALWAGILYDQGALDEAEALSKAFDHDDRHLLRTMAAKTGLQGDIAGRPMKQWAFDFVTIAAKGLKARQKELSLAVDETNFLDVLFEIAETGITPAERLLESYHTRLGQNVRGLYEEEAY